ncbi:MAG: N-acetylmuramic acid 6-phosphate etherase [Acholeplasmataceae bacterium]|jgi:N-acetylmuramic acid 6-phosphate etherase|nr:N-acetylmuramic acid 6-phosphate etherase [Acholeplasmataceae bacterium]HON63663.1 N-acetylmuramic acid 6-phosphate etherase [Bacilli bacterium]
MNKFNRLKTETRNPVSMEIDQMSTLEMLQVINQEDITVPLIIRDNLNQIAQAVDLIYEQLKEGGSLIYVGAGTSGRLGLLDAFECPPTFGVSPRMVRGVIAGGEKALLGAVEENEDAYEEGRLAIQENGITASDVVVGLSASGLTPFVLGALDEASNRKAKTMAIINNPNPDLAKKCDSVIVCETGPEVITGSTRMKAGTSQKLILNMISTSVMIKLGKVYQNLMVDVKPTNQKLINRSINIIAEATGESFEKAQETFLKTQDVKVSILMLKGKLNHSSAVKLLEETGGVIQAALNKIR